MTMTAATTSTFRVHSPVGGLQINLTPEGVSRIQFLGMNAQISDTDAAPSNQPMERQVRDALTAYFAGEPELLMALPYDISHGTAFQQRVWRALRTIPYGQVRTYRWLADVIGSPRAYRAVGSANGTNPLPLMIPCHRIVAADGTLGGFMRGHADGLDIKRALLMLEEAL